MPIIQQGSTNTNALVVPDLYVQIVPPQNLVLNGVPTNIIGVVGSAAWGPVNTAAVCGTMADYTRQFGAIQNRKFDMGTQVATAVQQGAANFRCVRVTDGTDVKAAITILTNCLTVTAKYTGSLGNSIGIQLLYNGGSQAATSKAIITLAGMQPEVFDNIPGTGSQYFWLNLASAINNGLGAMRGASQLVTAAAGVGTTTLTNATYTLIGGTDGANTVTAATLVGADTTPRTGMYALRAQGCGIGVLADADDSTQWTIQSAFGLFEGVYMILTCPAGSGAPLAISNGSTGAVDLKASAGIDSYACKLMHGDWLYWNDQVNNLLRLVSPQGFAAGRLANLSPEQSGLNKPLYGVVGSQKSGVVGSGQQQVYATADLTLLFQNGIDVISNPQPGGSFWGTRCGHNSSSNASVNGDNYTRLTNYIAATLAAGMGVYVGQTINTALFNNIRATLLSFLNNMLTQRMLGSTDGSLPFSVVCASANNPQSRTGLGYVQADVQVRYMGINEKFIVNLEGGVTVTISSSHS